MEGLYNAILLRQEFNAMDLREAAKEFEKYTNQKIPLEAIDEFRFIGLNNIDFITTDYLNRFGVLSLIQFEHNKQINNNDMATMKKSFKDLNEKMAEFEKKFKKEGGTLFKEICQEIFEKFPEIESFSWTQYTPYFNDGEECTFSVNEVDTFNGYSEYEEDQEGEGFNPWEEYSYDKKKTRSYEIVENIQNFVSSAPEGILRELFGDHARVTVYKNGKTESDEYEHD